MLAVACGGVGAELTADDADANADADANVGPDGVYEETNDDAKSFVDLVWDCKWGRIGKEGNGACFCITFTGFLEPEPDVMLDWLEFIGIWVRDEDEDVDVDMLGIGIRGGGICGGGICGGGFGGREGCRWTGDDVEADVGSGVGLAFEVDREDKDGDGDEPICRSLASIIAILSLGCGLLVSISTLRKIIKRKELAHPPSHSSTN